ncbi:polysaccharide deacetylase family sporulation protein PdaB [Caldalkalibacillus thermarum TA2.A1]|uniref:Polysaccharide deacetylase family sporulation protein PdaB n=1 Tax=Caldalkalibacillus thermarum (strain TA2.A1) TaxID=986075 RepID=F5L9I8_CALTT|nr:polysaccharide deacetylase family sporulation protein PdaB [Caldalkalibacillus thermarum]EGL81975.1 polysaccharide deacetylase family sporulation protein PdaB [Caldalkalibacillus thermarum TA2.A1]QZT34458.1 polysaccharide deacetylase family sporulation protein PdaB [Caldalkalibacillus thermarum TA2.A1]
MNTFWVINGQKVKKYILLIIAALFTAGVIYVERDAMSVFSSQLNPVQSKADEPQAIYRVPTDEKKLALTFDISWGQENPGLILDTLAENGVDKATFFLSSPWAEHHPEIVQRIKEMGFEIGSHGHKHINYTRLKNEEIREQILKAHRMLKSVTGLTPTLLRPPNGDFDKRVLRIADELGYTVVLWHTNSNDWMNPGVDRIVHNVVSNVQPGDIVLLHASDSAKQTHQALPEMIRRLKAEGYHFVTVTELITGTESQIKELD